MEAFIATNEPAPAKAKPEVWPEWLTLSALWATWCLVVAIGFWYGIVYGRQAPYSDDWHYTDFAMGLRPMTWDWLTSQHQGHRLVVARPMLAMLFRLGGGDMRSPIVCSVLVSAGVAAAMLLVARRTRGHARLSDAFFPLLLLRLDVSGFNWSATFILVAGAALLTAVLIVITRYGFAAPPRMLWMSVGMMALMLGMGGHGVAPQAPLLIWLVGSGLKLRGTRRAAGTAILAAALVLLGGLVGYFVGFTGSVLAARSLEAFMLTSVHAFTAPGGSGMTDLWPWSGIAVSLAVAATALANALCIRATRGEERQRAIALALAGAAAGSVLLAIGYGRGSLGWTRGLEGHYLSLALPFVCWGYFVWDRYGGRLRLLATGALVALALVTYTLSLRQVSEASYLTEQTEAFRRDACAGMPAAELATKHNAIVFYIDLETRPRARTAVVEGIRHMREQKFGMFACK